MKTKLLILFAVVLSIVGCENQENEFEDFGTTACYFPFQTPARSLILGKYDIGLNENDNNHAFEIGVTMAGVYQNTSKRKVHFELAPELLTQVENVKALPESHYTIETESPVIIPAGSIKGRIKIQLTDAFFEDTLAYASLNAVNYVVPLKITQAENLDSILTGVPVVSDPIRVKEADWEVTPKDYTLYGIKFMNKYQAMYLRRGEDVMTNAAGESVSSVYRDQYVERDELVMLTTSGKDSVTLSNMVRRGSVSSPGDVNLELAFGDDENCTVLSSDGAYDVSGTGKFVENGGIWGGKEHDAIFLDYSYTDVANDELHQVKDTLVVRNRNVVFEEFTVELKVD